MTFSIIDCRNSAPLWREVAYTMGIISVRNQKSFVVFSKNLLPA